jgi:hypothetical protein
MIFVRRIRKRSLPRFRNEGRQPPSGPGTLGYDDYLKIRLSEIDRIIEVLKNENIALETTIDLLLPGK